MDPEKEIRIVHATHPMTEQLFRMMQTPPEVIKASKAASQIQCTTCFTTRHKLQTCQRCKSVWYCSKECQKKDWCVDDRIIIPGTDRVVRPRHKAGCTPSDRPKGIKKLLENVAGNITLVSMLQVCAALDLDLFSNTKEPEIGFKIPFMIRVDIAVEPTNVQDWVTLMLTDKPMDGKIEGMIQFNCFRSHIPGQAGYAPLTTIRDTMWRNERDKLSKDPVRRNDPLGLLEFVNNDSDFSITMPLPVYSGPMGVAKNKEPFVMFSGLTGAKFEKPMTVQTCMEFMNTHIRSDKQNELKLRAEMTDEDKEIVRSARHGKNATRGSVVLLREKMQRESIYASLAQHLD